VRGAIRYLIIIPGGGLLPGVHAIDPLLRNACAPSAHGVTSGEKKVRIVTLRFGTGDSEWSLNGGQIPHASHVQPSVRAIIV
jgi:hypothetical protein